MANRQSRDPGALRRFDEYARIGDAPGFAVDTGDGWRVFAQAAGSLSGKLGKLADAAAAREGELAGLGAGASSGAAYLRQQAAQAGAAGKNGSSWRDAIASIESKGSGGYAAVGPRNGKMGRALGRYQIMEANIGPWSREALGRSVSVDEFMRDPAIQDAIFDHKFGGYVKKFGLEGAAQAWFAGPGGVGKTDRTDALGTDVGSYGQRFVAALGGSTGTPSAAPAGPIPGLLRAGNVDLANRPVVKNSDGSISTVRSMSYQNDAGEEVLIPTVSDEGKVMSNREAMEYWGKKGQSLGVFKDADSATAYAQRLHEAQASYYDKGGRNSKSAAATLPALPTQPLALRRDGTIYGEAYDRAAANAYAWRMQTGLETSMQAAYEANQNDPAALAGALAKVHDEFAQDPNLADPQMQEVFAKRFAERSQTFMLGAQSKAASKMREEEQAATFEGVAAQRQAVERQAITLGASEQGDEIIQREVERGSRSIDAAVNSGTMTPLQGAKAKKDLAETAATGRVRGVYEALDTPEKKEAFATGLMEDWTAGKGPLAKLPFDTVKALSQTLWNDARGEINRKTAAQKVEAARTEQLMDDDVASIAATGKGLDPTESGLTADAVSTLLGPEKLDAWRARRDAAQQGWQATSGMETQTGEDIADRLALLKPKPGEPGFENKEKIFDAATKKAAAVMKARADDPAAAVEAAFPDVQALAEQADPQNPESMQALVAGRLQAQNALGLSELAQAPLTNKEALSLARAVTAQPDPGKQAKAMGELVEQVQAVYGPHADAVLSQILQVKGIDKEMTRYGAGLFARLNRGQVPGSADRRQGGVINETAAADRAGAPAASDAWPLPNYKQQQMLLSNPDLASQYDQKFGPGAAQRLLGQMQSGTSRKADGGTATVDETGEGWTPDGR